MIAIYAGWLMKKEYSKQELNISPFWYSVWSFLVRYVAPIMVIIVFMNALGIIAFFESIFGIDLDAFFSSLFN